MAFDADEEILQDFLVEAGEILEQLQEQLVELEQNPDDADLLNAIFRGFHTVKGGAGFLQLDNLVDCCHKAENVFDILRNRQRRVTADLMDVVLQALDTVNEMFDQVKMREEPSPADPELIAALERLGVPESEDETAEAEVPEPSAEAAPEPEVTTETETPSAASADDIDLSDGDIELFVDALDEGGAGASQTEAAASPSAASDSGSDEITDDEFEALLDQLHGPGAFKGAPVSGAAPSSASAADSDATPAQSDSDEITDDEFEALLDQLHGKGSFSPDKVSPAGAAAPATPPAPEPAEKGSGGDDTIDEDEFEALLDQLHGPGKGPGVGAGKSESSAPPAAETVEEKPAAAKPVAPKPSAAPAQPAAAAAQPAAGAGGAGQKPPAARAGKPAARGAGAAKEAGIATETTVRVDTKRLDDIMNMVGELVLVRNRLTRLGEELGDEAMQKAVSNLDVVTSDLQSAVMQTRMQPIKKVFGRFPRVVRDLARNLKKEVNLVLRGEDTDLDKNLVEALSDPLVHLVRNAVDHGIEAPDVREKAGKPRVGRVVLAAEQEGDHILLSIEDDGAGMDPDVLRRKAVEKGLYDEDAAERLSDTECFNLIFAPGFSTKTEISDVSGRGVGMDVVKTKITQLNGSINIDSELGKGSRISIKVPLTLAIMPTLMVMLNDQAFAFPLVNVVEIFHLDLTKTNIVDGQECIVVREHVFPLFHIKRWLVKGAENQRPPRNAHVVIVAVGTKRVGFVVDQLVGQEEVVIKPLGKMLHGTPGMAGATITGDGRIALILDIPSLISHYAKSSKIFGNSGLRPRIFDEEDDQAVTA
ncbi:MAG: chemotaxis protein CheA [Gammaproteobacteria bacterium]|nr:MAG: chemotaxis protein CheA [Gammaproteobacteria bacterium]